MNSKVKACNVRPSDTNGYHDWPSAALPRRQKPRLTSWRGAIWRRRSNDDDDPPPSAAALAIPTGFGLLAA